MSSNPYVKSVLWLAISGGVGYGLMLLTEPSKEKLERIRASSSPIHNNAEDKKKALFMQKLQEAATTTPIYMSTDKKKE